MLLQKKRTTCRGVTPMDPLEEVGSLLFFVVFLNRKGRKEHGEITRALRIMYQLRMWNYECPNADNLFNNEIVETLHATSFLIVMQ